MKSLKVLYHLQLWQENYTLTIDKADWLKKLFLSWIQLIIAIYFTQLEESADVEFCFFQSDKDEEYYEEL